MPGRGPRSRSRPSRSVGTTAAPRRSPSAAARAAATATHGGVRMRHAACSMQRRQSAMMTAERFAPTQCSVERPAPSTQHERRRNTRRTSIGTHGERPVGGAQRVPNEPAVLWVLTLASAVLEGTEGVKYLEYLRQDWPDCRRNVIHRQHADPIGVQAKYDGMGSDGMGNMQHAACNMQHAACSMQHP